MAGEDNSTERESKWPLSGKRTEGQSPSVRISVLRNRAVLLSEARRFFAQRGVMEVDCPLLSPYASVDAHIDLIPAVYASTERRYLHSSPEYGMKRLLAEGMGDIYQLSHVFRDGEWGRKHNPEFMMAEWYRLGYSLDQLIEETLDFVRLFLGPLTASRLSYRQAFLKSCHLDPLRHDTEAFRRWVLQEKLMSAQNAAVAEKDDLLNVILGTVIEPTLGHGELTVLWGYPPSQAALAQLTREEGDAVAERFEVYYEATELANGYHELGDAEEQARRLEEANSQRLLLGKNALPLDERFLKALKKGLPDCCGVAVGFDRLMMLCSQASCIQDILPMGWQEA